MSLEAAVVENTNVLRELIAALRAGAPLSHTTTSTRTPEAKPEPEAKPAKAKAEKAQSKPAEPEPTQPDTTQPAEPVTYKDAAAAVTRLAAAKGRPAAVEILKQFEASSLTQVPAEQWAAVIASCEVALAA